MTREELYMMLLDNLEIRSQTTWLNGVTVQIVFDGKVIDECSIEIPTVEKE